MESGLDYEFRSTILPHFHSLEDLVGMAKLIAGAKKYYLQKFLTQGGKLWDKSLAGAKAFNDKEMAALAKACCEFVQKCEVR
jgi:pyruvate formate lyase activating enzyme